MVAPGLVLAGLHSHVGKTLLTAGLLRAFRDTATATDQPSAVGFKVGPDYIDPGYHQLASGAPCRNLDPNLQGAENILPLYYYGAEGYQLALVEGVMGLYDGRVNLEADAPRIPVGSTAHVAELLGLPILMVVDGSHTSETLAALLHGIRTYPGPEHPLAFAGALVNRVGSARHAAILERACKQAGMPVLGTIPTLSAAERPSRHLGLITAAEAKAETEDALDTLAAHLREHSDLTQLAAAASPPHPLAQDAWSPRRALDQCGENAAALSSASRPTIALISGPTFTFTYPEEVELLVAAGAECQSVDPLSGSLPVDCAGVLIPGGFPEEHLAELSHNTRLLRELQDAAQAGMPIWAECAGLVYLSRALDGTPLAGVVDQETTFSQRLTMGYRDAVCLSSSWAFTAGEKITGHEFHRTRLISSLAVAPGDTSPRKNQGQFSGGTIRPAWQWELPHHVNDATERTTAVQEGISSPTLYASYLHTHPVARPQVARRFVAAAQHYRGTWQAGTSPSGYTNPSQKDTTL